MMGGRIWAESEPGQGSTFKFEIGLQRSAADAPASVPSIPANIAESPILVVDDNTTSRSLIAEMFSNWRLKPVLAEDGARAFGMLLVAAQKGHPFRVAIIDDRMPEMDGEELVQRIADDPRLATTAVVMLRSTARPAVGDDSRGVIRASVAKPIKQSELLDALMTAHGLVAQKQRLETQKAAAQTAPARSLRLLLAEDNLVNQKLAVLLLEKQGHEITVVDDGRKAVEAWERAEKQGQPFDLILMDVQMPIMDGFAAVAEIRSREQGTGKHMPIIAMTAHAMKGDRERCLDAGMDGYVSKPIHTQELFAEIERFAEADWTRPATALRHDPPQPAVLPPASGSASSNGDVLAIDWSAALEHTAGDKSLMHAMIDVFLAESPKMLAEVHAALAAADAPRLRRAGHSIKGSCGYFAAELAYETAFAIERMGQSGDLSAASAAAIELAEQLDRLRPALVAFRREPA
jgi:CheY-like chemotaxis protein/HPt (histidine-containing phosphotransfer) domain-containing protein